MADYEPMRHQGAAGRKKKICIGVAIAVAIAITAAVVVGVLFLWDSGGIAGGFFGNRNSTNTTTATKGGEEFTAKFEEDKITFDVTMRLKRPMESRKRRSMSCDDYKQKFEAVCKNSATDFTECETEKLKQFLESYAESSFKDQLKANENEEPLFSGVNSTKFEMEIYNIKRDFIDIKATVTVMYEKILKKSDNETYTQNELKKLVDKIEDALDKCSNFLSSDVEFGLEKFHKYGEFKKVEKFLGEWDLISSEKFEEVLEAVGVGYMLRKIAVSQKPRSIIKYDEDKNEWNFIVSSPFRTLTTKFEVGKEFKEDLQNGSPGKSIIDIVDGKFVQAQTDLKGVLVSIQTRELVNDNEYLLTLDAGKVVAKRGYRRVKS